MINKQVLGVNHLALTVPDLEEGLAFFRDQLGFRKKFEVEFDGYQVVMLKAGKMELEIWADGAGTIEGPDSAEFGVHHFGVQVKNIEAVLSHMRETGVEILADIYEPTEGLKEAIVRGPGGVRVQFVEENVPRLLWGMISQKSKPTS